MKSGIAEFERDLQGWCFVAVDAGVDDLLGVLQKMFKGRVEHVAGIKLVKPKDGAEAAYEQGMQSLVLLRMKGSRWTIALIRVHAFFVEDGELATEVAKAASKTLKGKAVAALSEDSSGSFAEVFEKGKSTGQYSQDEDGEGFDAFFQEEGITLPSLFVAKGAKNVPTLMVAVAADVERADYVGIRDA